MSEQLIPAETQPQEAAAPHVVRLYGELMADLPQDLYIPPDALEVFLDAFEGPLDLLLYLIRKANINILDIPMAPLTVQYLEYVETMRVSNLELAAEYLVMAAMLIEIKSRMLLPRPRHAEEEEAEDPRAELVRRLVEYEKMKLAAHKIQALPQAERDFLWVEAWVDRLTAKRLPQVSAEDLMQAWRAVIGRVRMHSHHRVRRDELSVREHMTMILRRLQETGGFIEFSGLFDERADVPELVVHFLALLELAREHMVEVTQTDVFAPIYVRIADAANDSE